MPSTALRVAREAVRVDWSALTSGRAVAAAVGVCAPLAGGLVAHDQLAGVSMAAGALPVGVASLTRPVRAPLGTMVLTSTGMAVSTFVGAATGAEAGVHLALLASWGMAAGMMVALGNGASLVGLQALIAIVVFGRYAEPLPGAGRLAAFVMAGGLAEVVLTGAGQWAPGGRTERRLVAEVYRRLAAMAAGGPEASSLPAAEAMDDAARAVESTWWSGSVHDRLRALVVEAERIRLELLGLAGSVRSSGAPAPGVYHWLESALAAVADGVDLSRPGGRGTATAGRPCPTTQAGFPPAPSCDGALAPRLDALAGQLRAATALATAESSGRARLRWLGAGPAPAWGARAERTRPLAAPGLLTQLRSNVGYRSTTFRHAVRLGIAVPLASLLAAHSPLQRGYWVALTAAIVLKPDFQATISRGVARIGGTSLGVALASAVAALLHPRGAALVVVVGVLTWAAYATFRASYVLFSVFVTGLVVFLLSVVTPTPLGTAVDRLVDTIIGGALALILYAVWPTWAEADARQAMAELTDVLGRFLRTVLAGYTGASGPSDADAVEIRRLVRSLRRARSNAEAAVARSVSEPAAHRMDPHQAGDALSALRRMSLCGYALAVALPAPDQPRVSLPGLDVLRDELSEALGQIRASALHPGPVADPPPLRRVHSEIEGSVEARPGSAERWLLDVTDELVDAVDTAGFSLGTWRPFPARTASLE